MVKGIIISRDITQRKIAEQRLKESEERYRLISEHANDLIGIVNTKFEIGMRIRGMVKQLSKTLQEYDIE